MLSRWARRRPSRATSMATGRPVSGRTSRPAPIPASAGCRYGASSSPTRASCEELRDRIRFIRQAIVKRMELMYRPELEVLSAEERRDLLIALEVADRFRELGAHARGHGLSFDEACSVWMRVIDRMLPPTPPSAHERDRHVAAQARSRRWPPPAQRADQAVDHRGLSRAVRRRTRRRCRRRPRSPIAPAIPCARCSSAFPTSAPCRSRRPTTPWSRSPRWRRRATATAIG